MILRYHEGRFMNWEDFLSGLEKDNDIETVEFLKAIKFISEVEATVLEDSEQRSEINSMITKISEYIDTYQNILYEISLMNGFFYPLDNTEKIDRDYYYYIADQKMKAAVYYARYCNILETNQDKDIAYIKYLMLNNMMREVRFFGASYQYLWHWEKKKAHLFRNVSGSYDPPHNGLKAKGIKAFFEAMFNKVIKQMNQSREGTFSYSTDPFIDIFKYLKIKSVASQSDIDIEENGITLSVSGISNDSKAKFEIISYAEINSVFCGSDTYDYYSFIQSNQFNSDCEYPFAVELYPTLPEEAKNETETTKHIKDFIFNYLKSWSSLSGDHIGSWVADDKEVVTCGSIAKNTFDVTADRIPTYIDPNKSNTSYRMELNKEDVIYLILKLMEKDQKITDSFVFEASPSLKNRLSDWIKRVKQKQKEQDDGNDNTIPKFTGNYYDQISINISINNKLVINIKSIDPSLISGNSGTVDECVNTVVKMIIKMVKNYFTKRYETILGSDHKVADFILTFIKEQKNPNNEPYTCPEYIKKYNEFDAGDNDCELVLLKYCCFKKGDK